MYQQTYGSGYQKEIVLCFLETKQTNKHFRR